MHRTIAEADGDTLRRPPRRVLVALSMAQTPARIENWDTDEPSERDIEGIERMRLVRDDIARRVRSLATELG